MLLTRPSHVTLDPAGPLRAWVTRAVALEDGFRLELELEDSRGRLYTSAPLPAPRTGESVRLRIDGGVRFAREEAGRAGGVGGARAPAADDARAL